MTGNPFEMLDQVVITYSLKYLPCSKDDCLTCLTAKGHGPYWYAHFTLKGEQKDIFLGRSFKPMDLTKILMGDILKGKPVAEVEKEEQARAYEAAQASDHLDEALHSPHEPQAQAETASETLTEEAPQSGPAAEHHIDRVGKVQRTKRASKPAAKPSPPSWADFKQDLMLLEGAARSNNLKLVYRKLIKKYHPDQYASDSRLDQWMSEINGTYHRLSARA